MNDGVYSTGTGTRSFARSRPRTERPSRARRRTTFVSGRSSPQRAGDPRRQPASAPRDEDRVELVEILGELEPDRPVPGDHARVAGRGGRRSPSTSLPRSRSSSRHRRPPLSHVHVDDAPAQALDGGELCRRGVVRERRSSPARRAARAIQATPCAMLPVLVVTRPAASSSRGALSTAFPAPRILNEPIGCRFSSLSQISAGASAC